MGSPRRVRSPLAYQRARALRRTQNESESLVWCALRDRQLRRFKFRRQHPIGNYVVDFYCAAAALVIELDGATHDGREVYDAARQAWLESQGVLVLRFTNDSLSESFEAFLKTVEEACERRTKDRLP